MTTDDIQQIIDYSYPKIQSHYGKGKLDYPPIELHQDIYARLSGDAEARGEHSSTSIAQYDKGKIYIYYPNVKTEEDILRALIHEYTHYTQDSELFAKYRDMYDYDEDPTEIEAHKNEEDWHLFSQK
tara:strand:+ start:158 stop:538 length:381 start_codon:yes stop_codon:yes gene_type:complete